MALRKIEEWDLDIDRYINRIIPPSPLYRLPTPISRFLGYRKEKKQNVGNVLGAFWSCIGAFCGLAVIAAVFNNTGSIQARHPPTFVASFGASAILEYNAIRSPLGQPRNAVLGHTFSALVGVGITKLFRLRSDFEKLQWIAGAVSCGAASAVMLLTGTIHPPGGASAVLAATEPNITNMGWYFVPLVMLGTTLMLVVALVINNIQRQFPVYWWTPLEVRKTNKLDEEVWPDGNGGLEQKTKEEVDEKSNEISISAAGVSLPPDLALNEEEAKLLQALRNRLQRQKGNEETTDARRYSGTSSAGCTMVPSHVARTDSDASILNMPEARGVERNIS